MCPGTKQPSGREQAGVEARGAGPPCWVSGLMTVQESEAGHNNLVLLALASLSGSSHSVLFFHMSYAALAVITGCVVNMTLVEMMFTGRMQVQDSPDQDDQGDGGLTGEAANAASKVSFQAQHPCLRINLSSYTSLYLSGAPDMQHVSDMERIGAACLRICDAQCSHFHCQAFISSQPPHGFVVCALRAPRNEDCCPCGRAYMYMLIAQSRVKHRNCHGSAADWLFLCSIWV
jgi:hypothetical protein